MHQLSVLTLMVRLCSIIKFTTLKKSIIHSHIQKAVEV